MKRGTPRSSTAVKMWCDDEARMKTILNLNNASNICTMYQISNIHHYLQVERSSERRRKVDDDKEKAISVGKKSISKRLDEEVDTYL
jgi:hypothetical protein